jgi:hypothetical protein
MRELNVVITKADDDAQQANVVEVILNQLPEWWFTRRPFTLVPRNWEGKLVTVFEVREGLGGVPNYDWWLTFLHSLKQVDSAV